jgi:Peptidase family M28
MAPLETIEHLVLLGPRWPGTEGERRAAEYLAQKLEGLGREARIEPIRVQPAYHLTHALHAALAVVGSVVSVYARPFGVIILMLVALSMYGDLTARFYLARRLMPRRSSQNVTSPGPRSDAPARLVLTAHYDAARSGLVFARPRRPGPRLLRRLTALAGPIDIVFWTVMIALALAVVRLFSGDSTLVTAVQFAATVPLLVAVLLFVDVALSEVVPGAADNASGVAATLELGRRLAARPLEHLDLWLVFPGAEEGLMLGMRAWMRAHEPGLDARRTFFVNIDTVGRGIVRLVAEEGFVLLERHDPRLVELGRKAASDPLGARPYRWRIGTDGTIPVMRGFPSVTVCCTDEHDRIPHWHRHSDSLDHIQPAAVERAIDFVEELARRIDSELVPALLPSLRARPAPDAT